MKKIILLFCLAILSCNKQVKETGKEVSKGFDFDGLVNKNVEVKIIVIDSCEYLYAWFGMANGGGSFTHKGNCKFCIKRKQ